MTEIICVIDRSGSMYSLADDAIGGFNSFLEQQKAVGDDAKLTLVLFNDKIETIHDRVDINAVEPLTDVSYKTGGSTSLLDAIGMSVDSLSQQIAEMDDSDKPDKVVVSILTDGAENTSREYVNNNQIPNMIKEMEETYGWEFFFLAANQDAIGTAQSLNISGARSFNFDANSADMNKAYFAMSSSVMKSRTGVTDNVDMRAYENMDLDEMTVYTTNLMKETKKKTAEEPQKA